MIDDLDRSLEALLKQHLPTRAAIRFEAPAAGFPPAELDLPALNLFLCEVREAPDPRGQIPTAERAPSGMALKSPPPLRIECVYLVTAWAGANSPASTQVEHRLLGEVLQIFRRFSVLPVQVLQGDLANQEAPPSISLLSGGAGGPNGFWQLLGCEPRAVLPYKVTMALPSYESLSGDERPLRMRTFAPNAAP